MMSPRSYGAGGVSAMAIRRRTLLKGMLGAGALAPALPTLSACGDDSGGGGGGAVTFGSNWSDEVPKKGIQAMMDGCGKGKVAINTVEHNSFQENINNYLQGGPDDVFGWFAGNRMQFFAEQGLDRRHQRRVVGHRRRLLRRDEAAVDRQGRQAVLRADLLLPVGGLLPEERVAGEGLRATGHFGRVQDPRRAR